METEVEMEGLPLGHQRRGTAKEVAQVGGRTKNVPVSGGRMRKAAPGPTTTALPSAPLLSCIAPLRFHFESREAYPTTTADILQLRAAVALLQPETTAIGTTTVLHRA